MIEMIDMLHSGTDTQRLSLNSNDLADQFFTGK